MERTKRGYKIRALEWLIEEVEINVGDAQDSLCRFIENPDAVDSLRRCRDAIHEIRGVLLVADINGIVPLLNEVIAVIDSMISSPGMSVATIERCETLAQSIDVVPVYLHRTLVYGEETPGSLYLLAMDLRALRGTDLLPAGNVLNPDYAIVAPPQESPVPHVNSEGLATLLKPLRQNFNVALLGILKGENEFENIKTLEKICAKLRELCKGAAREQLWWVAGAFFEALFYHAVTLRPVTRQILRELEKELSATQRSPAEQLAAPFPEKLFKAIIFCVAASASPTPRVESVMEHFDLQRLSRELAIRTGFGERNYDIKIVQSISAALLTEVEELKELLAKHYVDPIEPDYLPAAMHVCRAVVRVLEVVGQQELLAQARNLEASLVRRIEGGAEADADDLELLAKLVVEFESSCSAWENDTRSDHAEDDLPEDLKVEVNRAWNHLLQEIAEGLEVIKSTLVEFFAGRSEVDLLGNVPSGLRQLSGTLRIIGLDMAGQQLDLCADYINRELASESPVSTAQARIALAETITSVEYYLEGVACGMDRERVEALSLCASARDLLSCADRPVQAETPALSMEVETMSPKTDTPTNDGKNGGRDDSAKAPERQDIDPEIREIFIEEAGEVLAGLNQAFPAWQNDIADTGARGDVRRAFHTLKGSGRMVGAEEIGELAWSVENMLNKVIDNRIEAGATVQAVVGAAIELASDMVAQFNGEIDNYDAEQAAAIRDASTRLASGEPVEFSVSEVSTPDMEQEETVVDPALLEIFVLEAAGHLEVVNDFIDRQRQNAPFYESPPPRLQAALHTLKGSAYMADIEPVATVITPLERLVKELLNFKIKVDEETVELLTDCHKFSRTAIAAIEQGRGIASEEMNHLIDRIDEQRDRLLGAILGQDEEEHHVDPSLLNVLMADGMEMVLDAEDVLEVWRSTGAIDKAQLDTMIFDLRQLVEGAAQAGCQPMEKLSNALANLYDRFKVNGEQFTDEQYQTLCRAHDALLNMADSIAALQDVSPAEPVLLQSLEEIEPCGETATEKSPEPVVEEEVDEEILALFIDEGQELLESLEQALHDWSQNLGEGGTYAEGIKRDLHTFKGGARMAGRIVLGDLIHDFESQVIASEEQVLSGDEQAFRELVKWYDKVAAAFDTRRKKTAPVAREPERAQPEATEMVNQESVPPQVWTTAEILPFTGTYKGLYPQEDLDSPESAQAAGEQVRITASVLDNLVNLAGESSIARSQIEQNISEFAFSLDEMEATIRRMQDQVRRMAIETDAQVMFRREQLEAADSDEGFDPLEMDRYSQLQQLSRSLLESTSDLQDLRNTLLDKSRDAESQLLQQSRINTDLQEGLMRTRMVPFSRIVPRLRRVVRQVGSTVGKQVSLDLVNVDGELDRTVLERVIGPLEHMIRNAIDHGIEPADQRRDLGKDEEGTISMSFAREGGDVLIRIADDGRGLNIDAIREKAFSMGLLSEKIEYSDSEIAQYIFHPGFSTSTEVTQTSGRGVGMDVVDSEVRQLGGSVAITTQKGAGTEFLIRLPFTVSVNRALMIEVGEDSYALALNSIDGIIRASVDELLHYYQHPNERLEYGGESYEVRYLGSLLAEDITPNLDTALDQLPLVLIRGEEKRYAVQVDGLIGSREIVVKTLGNQFNRVPGLSGATVLGDGRVVVILDLSGLLRHQSAGAVLPVEVGATGDTGAWTSNVQTIMVVDDSVTVRKVTSRFLEREGFRVITAKDGVDAMRALQDLTPDMMLLDIEMPRMDGFEVARLVRSTQRLKNLPIIMITSRTGEKHRERALAMGVNRYLGKPYQEEVLMREVYGLLTSVETEVSSS